MTRGFPDFRVHNNGRVHGNDLDGPTVRTGGRTADHVLPPGFLEVALQFGAQRAIVPEAINAAVQFGRLKDKPAPPA